MRGRAAPRARAIDAAVNSDDSEHGSDDEAYDVD